MSGFDNNYQQWVTEFPVAKRLHFFDRDESYEGSGAAVIQDENDQWFAADYSHCSCNGFEDTINVASDSLGSPTYEAALRYLGEADREDLAEHGTWWPNPPSNEYGEVCP